MSRLVFKILGMDCAEEVAVLKRELGPLVGGEELLGFDLINGKMTVELPENGISEEDVRSAVAHTGMRAVPWREHTASIRTERPWDRHGRAIMCCTSGLFLVLGFWIHAAEHGWLDALAGDGQDHAYPLRSIALYSLAVIAGAWFVIRKALYAASRLRPDMNLLMTVAVAGAIVIGEWFEAATVAFLFAVALLLESWSVGRARRAVAALMDLAPVKARYRSSQDGAIEEKPVEEVPVGATVLMRPGEKIPLDGVVSKGVTTVNQAPITGESAPVSKAPGEEVFAGAVNNEGAFEFRVTKAAKDTTLARIIHLVQDAQSRRAPSEQWVEKFARYYTPAMMCLALGIALVPPLAWGAAWSGWFYETLVILVIACPCALVISTPVSIVAGLASAARAGVLIKGGAYLEAPAQLGAIAMDKTGTLTYGRPEIREVFPLNGHTEEELLERAAALESHSEHPLARAILRGAEKKAIAYSPAEGFQAIKGKGAVGTIGGRRFWVGSHRFVHEMSREHAAFHHTAEALEDAGHSVIAAGNDEHVCGFISVADQVRPQSPAVVKAVKDAGIRRVVMLTGDNEGTARAVAAQCGIDAYHAELLPEDKVRAVEGLVREHKSVAMVGDGINDAPAMAAATLGIAMGAMGSDAAIETADIALMGDDLTRLPWLIQHSRRTLRVIKQNVAFALAVKAACIAFALAGTATLWLAIAADMGASLLVIFNGLRLLDGKTSEMA